MNIIQEQEKKQEKVLPLNISETPLYDKSGQIVAVDIKDDNNIVTRFNIGDLVYETAIVSGYKENSLYCISSIEAHGESGRIFAKTLNFKGHEHSYPIYFIMDNAKKYEIPVKEVQVNGFSEIDIFSACLKIVGEEEARDIVKSLEKQPSKIKENTENDGIMAQIEKATFKPILSEDLFKRYMEAFSSNNNFVSSKPRRRGRH